MHALSYELTTHFFLCWVEGQHFSHFLRFFIFWEILHSVSLYVN
ncbi:hypothetical protein PVAG01_03495 [Phlyctema vagabunda]|uniref:Uncharacterized protein n=1 Tax=Phlyctema vagabunda TaxID=108571 RepID=A0ABR4PLN6_9HELO